MRLTAYQLACISSLVFPWFLACSSSPSTDSTADTSTHSDIVESVDTTPDIASCNPQDCDDDNLCTINDCFNDECVFAPLGPDYCFDGDACTEDSCDPQVGCQNLLVSPGEDCDDGDPCTLIDICGEDGCEGVPKVCPPSEEQCVEDVICAPDTGLCKLVFSEGDECDDGNICTEEDQCGVNGCNGQPLPICDDGNPCTNDDCDPITGCSYSANDFPCDDDNACTENDTCDQTVCDGQAIDCEDGGFCEIVDCIPETGCVSTFVQAPCDDGNNCTIGDACENGACQAGALKDCDDGNPCTTDACNSTFGNCTHPHNTEPCLVGDLCNSSGVCLNGECIDAIPECDDGIPCTLDVCDTDLGCTFLPKDNGCDDGVLCNGAEVCSPVDGCTEGPVEGLDDGIECTVDLCDEQEGISHIPSDALCSTGAPCNADYCDVSTGGCAPAVLPDCCGNGFVELDEECDDGNQVEGDGCKPSCQVEDECPIWTKTYTAEGSDQPTAIVYLGAPGYAFAGTTSGEGNDSFGFLTFINTKGSFINTILYGLGGTNALHDLIVTEDGGFAMAGSSNASFTGTEDFYLVRAYANGVFAWSRTIGGDLVETARALIQTEDGGFALAGQTHSFGEGGADAWLVRNEPNGDLIWANAYGGSEDDVAWDLVQTQGQEFTVVGSTHSAGGNQDGYLFHTLSDGTLLWEKKFDLGADESLNAMVHTPNEDYILAGTTTINGETDLYVVRTDDVGAVIWEDVIETPGVEETVSDIQLAEDGGLLISGSQTLSDNTTMPWATRMTPTGEVVWDMAFANAAGAQGRELAAIPGGGFVLLAGQNTPESDPISLLKGNAWGHTSCPEAGVCETISFADCDDGLSCNDVSICDPTEGCTPVNPLFNCCGNGDLDPGEECDDSNLVNGDGCSSECLLETEP